MKKTFTVWIFPKLMLITIMAWQLISCAQKKTTTREIDMTLNSISSDSVTAITKLEDEILFRTADSVQVVADTKVIVDSIMVFGDTISWKIRKRIIRANEDLKGFPTDSLIKLFNEKSIYLVDNRQDWYELNDQRVLRTMTQTVCLIDRNKIKRQANGKYLVKARAFREALNLCTAERFVNQPAAGFCSGFAVAKRIIVTAGHCVTTSSDLSNFSIIFNFRQEAAASSIIEFDPDDVYTGVELIKQQQDQLGQMDFAVIRVDHDIRDDRIAKVRATDVQLAEPVFVIGYPCGLPVKFADGAKVIDNREKNFFLADLDTFGGNSGSPVYDSTHSVVGILVRGIKDFGNNEALNCKFSYVCRKPGSYGCEGEGISRTAQFISFIGPQTMASAKNKKASGNN